MHRAAGILLLLAFAAVAPAEDSEVLTLRRRGLEPNYDSLRAYLRALYPAHGTEAELRALIADLGHASAPRREFATRALLQAGASAAGVLAGALDADDPEVVRRVRWLLGEAERMLEPDPIYATYMTIARRRILGLAEEVLRTLPLAKDGYVRAAGHRALVATATRKSANALREALRTGSSELREAVVRALAAVLKEDASEELRPLLTDKDPRVRYSTAMALAERRDRASLEALVILLESPRPEQRYRAAAALRKLTGQKFFFAAYAEESKRKPKVELWRAWVRERKGAVDWEQARAEPVGYRNRILIARNRRDGSGELVEIELDGTVVVRHAIKGKLRGVRGLSNGNRLASLADRRLVIEYDARGHEVWRSPTLPGAPASAQRLTNGNTLVAVPSVGEVHEIMTGGETVLVLRPGIGCHHAERLASGITRIALYNGKRIVEMQRNGKVKRQSAVAAGPLHVTRLDGGNLLVCLALQNRVDELDPKGAVRRSLRDFSWPTTAFRIANGVTIVSDKRGVWKVDRDGRRHHIFVSETPVRISYY